MSSCLIIQQNEDFIIGVDGAVTDDLGKRIYDNAQKFFQVDGFNFFCSGDMYYVEDFVGRIQLEKELCLERFFELAKNFPTGTDKCFSLEIVLFHKGEMYHISSFNDLEPIKLNKSNDGIQIYTVGYNTKKANEELTKVIKENKYSVSNMMFKVFEEIEDEFVGGKVSIYHIKNEKVSLISYKNSSQNGKFLVAEVLMGNLICGNNVIISNDRGSLEIGDKIKVDGLDFIITGGGHGDETLEDALAGAGNKTYRQPTPPVPPLKSGDVWYDTSNNNRIYRWDGTRWVDTNPSVPVGINMLINSLPNKGSMDFWAKDYDTNATFGNETLSTGESNLYLSGQTNKEPFFASKWYSCEPNTKYTLSFEYQTASPSSLKFQVCGSTKQENIGEVNVYPTDIVHNLGTLTNLDWTEGSASFTTTKEEIFFQTRFINTSGNNVSKIKLRKIQLEKGEKTEWEKCPNEDAFYEGSKPKIGLNLIINSAPDFELKETGWTLGGATQLINDTTLGYSYFKCNNVHYESKLWSKWYYVDQLEDYVLSLTYWSDNQGSARIRLMGSTEAKDPSTINNGTAGLGTEIFGQIISAATGFEINEKIKIPAGIRSVYISAESPVMAVPNQSVNFYRVKFEKGSTRTAWDRNNSDVEFLKSLEASDKINEVTNADGSLNPSKLLGDILTGKSNIIVTANDPPMEGERVTAINERGIVVGSINRDGSISTEGTFITKDGINASMIKTGRLDAVTMVGGDPNGIHTEISQTNPLRIDRGLNKPAAEIWVDEVTHDAYLAFRSLNSTYADRPNFKIDAGGAIHSIEALGILTIQTRDDTSTPGSIEIELDGQSGVGTSTFSVRPKWWSGGVENSPIYLKGGRGSQYLVLGASQQATWDATYVDGNLSISGTVTAGGKKPATVLTDTYGWRQLYSEESDRVYFNTHGSNKTTLNKDGKFTCIIKLDPVFMQTIEPNSTHPYLVQVTPHALALVACTNKHDKYVVIESDREVSFDYTIRCTRKGEGHIYIPEVENKFNPNSTDAYSITYRKGMAIMAELGLRPRGE